MNSLTKQLNAVDLNAKLPIVNHAELYVTPASTAGQRARQLYPALESNTETFRLLHLLPGKADDQIRVRLRTAQIKNEVDRYVAVSYTWGPPESDKFIFVNGTKFPVRENLYALLRAFRNTASDRVLWIDAICINQFTTHERNHQVSLMGTIYRNALRVDAWLGERTATSDWLFDFLNNRNLEDLETELQKGLPTGQCRAMLRALNIFARGFYWSRIWIVQELVLANDIRLVCGDRVLEWEMIEWLWAKLRPCYFSMQNGEDNDPHKMVTDDNFRPWDTQLFRLQTSRQNIRPQNLENLLEVYDTLLSTMVHDQIYALLGLESKDDAQKPLPVDYNVPLEVLACQVLGHCNPDSPLGFSRRLMYRLGIDIDSLTFPPSIKSHPVALSLHEHGRLGNTKLNTPTAATAAAKEEEESGPLAHEEFEATTTAGASFDHTVHYYSRRRRAQPDDQLLRLMNKNFFPCIVVQKRRDRIQAANGRQQQRTVVVGISMRSDKATDPEIHHSLCKRLGDTLFDALVTRDPDRAGQFLVQMDFATFARFVSLSERLE